jgi:hypothetical protein
VNTHTRISEECPMAIHSVELWLKGLAAVGVSPISAAQMLGHSSTQTVPRYAQVLDQNRLGAMRKLEALRHSLILDRSNQESGQSAERRRRESVL